MDSEHLLPPTPRALSDVELQEVLDRAKAEGGGILAAMQILEAQAQLRETDKSELRAWEAQQSQADNGLPVVEEVSALQENPDSAPFNFTGSEEEEATAIDEVLVHPAVVLAPMESEPIVFESATASPTSNSPLVEPFVEPEATPNVVAVQPQIEVLVQTKRGAKDPSSSQFWVWLPISGSLLPFGLALWLRSLGLTFAQSLVAALLGIFVSAGVVAVGAIAGKRSSLPTLVLARAAFGVLGNLGPAALVIASRLFWALVLVILGYLLIAQNLATSSHLTAHAEPVSWLAVAILCAIVAGAVVLSSFGGTKLVWAQRVSGVFGIATAATIAGMKLGASGLALDDNQGGSWLRALGAAVVIFALFGLAWSSASSDYASGLPVNTRGWKVASWAFLSMGLVPALLATLGLLAFGNLNDVDFAASFDAMATGQEFSALNLIVQLSLLLTLVTTIAMSLRSSSMSFESVHLKVKVSLTTPVIASVAVALAVLGLSRLGAIGFWFNLHGYALFLAVPVAAWSGVFVSDVLIRRIAYHEVSLSRSYGFYKAANLTNLLGWALAVFIGWGLLRSNLIEFQWLGYLPGLSSNQEFWSQSNFGVVISFAIGLLLPVAAGIPRIKHQEAEVLAIEARRNDLKDVLGLVD